MIYLDELKKMKLYNKQFYLPLPERDKKHGNAVMILSNSIEDSVDLLQNPLINPKYYESYYIEKRPPYIVNNEGYIDLERTLEFLSEAGVAMPKLSEPQIASNDYKHDTEFPKKLEDKLRREIKKPKYQLNQISDVDRNNIGTKQKRGRELISNKIVNSGEKKETPKEESVFVNYSNFKEDMLELENGEKLLFVNEASNSSNAKLKKMMYATRLRTNKDLYHYYDIVKSEVPYIKYAFADLRRYNKKNLLIDLSFYNSIFLQKNLLKRDRGVDLYFQLLSRLLDDRNIQVHGYNKVQTVFVNLSDIELSKEYMDFNKNINLVSLIIRKMKKDPKSFLQYKGIDFVFMGSKRYFICDLAELNLKTLTRFRLLLESLMKDTVINLDADKEDEDNRKDSKQVIKDELIEKLADAKINIKNLTGDDGDPDKEIVKEKIEKAASISTSVDGAIEELEQDNELKELLSKIQDYDNEPGEVKMNKARASRMMAAQDRSKEKQIKNRTIKDILSEKKEKELPVTSIQIDSVNDEWKNMQYINFEEYYDLDKDILSILYSFSEKSDPVAILSIDVEDTSTSEDFVYTWTVKMEDSRGKRFNLKFDIPKLIDNKFMKLRGNQKTMNAQLTFIGVVKTDEDTAQVISNYKKIFIYRYGSSFGKSTAATDVLVKFFKKYKGNKVKVIEGDNTKICSKYELPMDYLDLAGGYNTIETSDFVIYFNPEHIIKTYNADPKKLKDSIPLGYDKKNKEVIYWKAGVSDTLGGMLYSLIWDILDKDDKELLESIKPANKFMYSRANILNHKIPLIVIMAHSEGLTKSMEKGNVRYEKISDKRPKKSIFEDIIKFKDGYIVYEIDYNSSLLMNGLKDCNTEDYSITEIDDKSMWLDMLDIFGGRILSDGLDNFYDLMVDPITKECLEYYNLPTDYCELLAYANFLLCDNKYARHVDQSARRYRSNELIAGYAYQALAESYGAYRTEYKKRGSAIMTIKQSAIIDKIMLDPTCSDLSDLNDIGNAESINAVSYKGLAGLNHDRSYSLDKRGYDPSMLNNIAMSTGFAGNVGVTRQTTMDMNIESDRGFIKTIDGDTDQMSITKTFSVTEGMNPFGCTRDDPMRTAMNFIQTSKHGMRIKKATPMLISNGTDMALPYMTSNVFSYNAKADGKIIEVTPDYMILEYKDKTHEFVDLRSKVKKNSNGGFYQTIKLDTKMKPGQTFKKHQVIAYDKLSYSDIVGPTDDIAYANWCFVKGAMLVSDANFEDSAVITEYISDAMSSKVVVEKEVMLPKNTNVYSIVEKGQRISEGEPLIIFQNAFDDEDITLLLKNLGDDEDIVSDLGRIPVKSKVTGLVEDIRIFRTVDKEELSDSLKKIVNKIDKPVKDMEKALKKYGIENKGVLESTDVLDKTGVVKNVEDGILIKFYLSYEDKLSIGDKIIYQNACKGVVKDVIPKGQEPKSEYRPEEPIDTIVPYFGSSNRLVSSIAITMALNKVLVELDRHVKDMCGIKWTNLHKDD